MRRSVKGSKSMAPGFLNGFCLTRTVITLCHDTIESDRSMIGSDLVVINAINQSAATLAACKKRGQRGRWRSAGHHPVKVMFVEIGYTSETRYAEKVQENMMQHGTLQRFPSSLDFEVNILPVSLGTTGGVFSRVWTALEL